ncbi:MAG: MotA/TolQ/ExbB proton channel family protein [Bacteroidetes bacterium]|nr:MAG: MotA/TolQ/ExbB proton channel family protein [Bacteroidota bacterium]
MMSQIIDKIYEGGPFFTFPIVFLLILILVLIVKGFLNINKNSKTISLISSLGWFTLVWGILGQTLGLVAAFDAIQSAGDISKGIMAAGLKVALITTIFGLFTFLVARLGIIILTWMNNEAD